VTADAQNRPKLGRHRPWPVTAFSSTTNNKFITPTFFLISE
jgi:hypothetical protein